jgi:hypothetical protein
MIEAVSLSTADLVLGIIGVVMALSAVGAIGTSLSIVTALGAGTVPAAGTVGYALFYDPPVSEE